jgi:multiple sugar transport system substrate-binding protein
MLPNLSNARRTPLKGLGWDHPRGLDALKRADAQLQEDTGLRVDWIARSLQEFSEQTPAELYAGFDLVSIDHPHVPHAVENGQLVALDLHASDDVARLARESVGPSHASYRYQGHQWGLATDAAAQVSAFRPDLVDCAPLLWDDVFERATGKTVLWPYKPVDAICTLLSLCAQLGHPAAGGGEQFSLNGIEHALEILQRLASLVPDWCAEANPIDVAEALTVDDQFTTGIAMFGYSNYSRRGFRQSHLVYQDISSFDGESRGAVLGGAGLAVSAQTERVEDAVTAAVFLSSASCQSNEYLVGGGQPGNLYAWKSHRVNVATEHFFSNTLRTLEKSWVRPQSPGWPDAQRDASRLLHEALVARRSDRRLAQEIQTILESGVMQP